MQTFSQTVNASIKDLVSCMQYADTIAYRHALHMFPLDGIHACMDGRAGMCARASENEYYHYYYHSHARLRACTRARERVRMNPNANLLHYHPRSIIILILE